jgi:tetratricopeptide (TPR) repeat protein
MNIFFRNWFCLLIFCGVIGTKVFADETTHAPATPQDYYNAGTRLLAAKHFAEAERMFQLALAAQNADIQPLAEYNLGETRFTDGAEMLKKSPDAQKVSAQGTAARADSERARQFGDAALTENNLEKIITAYIEGRGARRDLRAAEKAVKSALETYGKTLQKWQRADNDFKSTAELDPAATNAVRNAKIVERNIARLVDQLQQMQAMMNALVNQRQDLTKMLNKLKGQIPTPNTPPGAAGDEDEDNPQPDSLAGQKEGGARDGDQTSAPLSPESAGQILDGLGIDGTRRLAMSDKETKPAADRKGRNW